MHNVISLILIFVVGISLELLIIFYFNKHNKQLKRKYRYIVFYKGGRKATYEYELTDSENKQLNDTLNKNPNVSSYDVFEDVK